MAPFIPSDRSGNDFPASSDAIPSGRLLGRQRSAAMKNPAALTPGMILYIAAVAIIWAITMAHAALH